MIVQIAYRCNIRSLFIRTITESRVSRTLTRFVRDTFRRFRRSSLSLSFCTTLKNEKKKKKKKKREKRKEKKIQKIEFPSQNLWMIFKVHNLFILHPYLAYSRICTSYCPKSSFHFHFPLQFRIVIILAMIQRPRARSILEEYICQLLFKVICVCINNNIKRTRPNNIIQQQKIIQCKTRFVLNIIVCLENLAGTILFVQYYLYY